MLIVKLDSAKNILVVAPYEKLFYNTPMPEGGLDDQWFIDNNCVRYTPTRYYNPDTQMLVGSEYYVENNIAYNVKVVDLSEEDKQAIRQAKMLLS